MKTILLSTLAAVLLCSCDPNSDKKVGNPDRFRGMSTDNGSGSGGSGTGGSGGGTNGAGSTTDAPLDGGLSVLLVAGAAYGAKRMRRTKQKSNAA